MLYPIRYKGKNSGAVNGLYGACMRYAIKQPRAAQIAIVRGACFEGLQGGKYSFIGARRISVKGNAPGAAIGPSEGVKKGAAFAVPMQIT